MLTRQTLGLVFVTALTTAAAQNPPQLRATEEMRISGDAQSLIPFSTLLVGPDGRIVVPQRQDGQLLFFDANGRKLGTFGRKGAGPGEFNFLDGTMGWLGDTLWVYDRNNARRLTFVSKNLRLVRSQSVGVAAPFNPNAPSDPKHIALANVQIDYSYADGTMLLRSAFGPMDPEMRAPTDYRYVVVNAAGDVLRVLLRLPDEHAWVVLRDARGMFTGGGYVPFSASVRFAVSSNGLRVGFLSTTTVSGAKGSYSVTVVRAAGDTAFSRTYSYDPARIPAAAKDSVIAAILQSGRVSTPEGRFPGEAFANKVRPLIPATYAPVLELLLGDDDTTWLVMRDAASVTRYRALDGKGNVLGEVVLSSRSHVARATRTQLWVIENDTDGVPSIIRYRIGTQ
jgi:hypothetical protein